MTDPREWLDAVDARTNAATHGPWHALTTGRAGGDHWHVTDAGESLAYIHASDGEDENRRQPDAEFIARARTDLPAATTALRAVLDLCDAKGFGQVLFPDDIRAAITTALSQEDA